MIFTARQLEDLHRSNGSNGQLVLPYRARLTPLAQDWIKARKLTLGYSDAAEQTKVSAPSLAVSQSEAPQGAFLWWCDGPCGPAKAALVSQARESSLAQLKTPEDSKRIVHAVKELATEVKQGRAIGGILLVQTGAMAVVYANRCPSLRAILGTCLDAVEQGVQQLAANVLVIEHPYKTLQQVKNMLSRFVRAKRGLSDDVKRQLQELATCG